MENDIKFFIIDQLGMVIGELCKNGTQLSIKNPLLIQPSQQQGSFSLSSNPFFEESMDLNEAYVVVQAVPKKAILEQYNSFLTKKRTGLVTAKGELIK